MHYIHVGASCRTNCRLSDHTCAALILLSNHFTISGRPLSCPLVELLGRLSRSTELKTASVREAAYPERCPCDPAGRSYQPWLCWTLSFLFGERADPFRRLSSLDLRLSRPPSDSPCCQRVKDYSHGGQKSSSNADVEINLPCTVLL